MLLLALSLLQNNKMRIAKGLTKPKAIWKKPYLKMCVEFTLKSSVHCGSEGANCHGGDFGSIMY